LSGKGQPALFVFSPRGDAAAGRRALGAVAGVLQVPALARPLDAFVGPLGITTASREIPGIGTATELRFRRTARPGPGEEAVAVDVALSSRDGSVALIAGSAGAGARLGELL